MLFKRFLLLPKLLAKKSFFLFGPRATGKSYLIKEQLADKALVINLLQSEYYLRLMANPGQLEEIVAASHKELIVIDEIQRVPGLLNEVHRLIEAYNYTFLLTGSSTRKLKNANVNMLAGRAWVAHFFPLTSAEIPDFDLGRYLRYGGMPVVYNSVEPDEELFAYVNTYLKEEIQAEALVRKVPAFARFLLVSALTSGQIVNFTNIGQEAGVPVSTVKEYYRILEDTLLGFWLPAWTKSIKRVAVAAPKFYYFDLGVRNTLAGIKQLDEHSNLYGFAFEQFIILEMRAYLDYMRVRQPMGYWRSKNGNEVDLLIGTELAIEIKATNNVTDRHIKGLLYLKDEGIIARFIMVSQDMIRRNSKGVEIMSYREFLSELWAGKII